jgi:hypothetical protein
MLRNPIKPKSDFDEGTVIQVDVNNTVCKVKTLSGQNLDGVMWQSAIGNSSRAGDRVSPTLGDRVTIDYRLGYPIITGCLPRIQTSDNTFPLSIDSGTQIVNTGDYSSGGGYSTNDANKPADMLSGDRVLASIGGGMIALLRAGSVLLRSSRLSEIFLSKWDDLVRITSRNWEHFTDVSTDIVKNLRGRVYRYTGYANTWQAASTEAYQYNLYYGDTALAQAVKSAWQTASNSPSANNIIFREEVAPGGAVVMYRTLDLSGNEIVHISGGGAYTQMQATGSTLTFTYNGQSTIIINPTQISLVQAGGGQIVMDSNGIRSTFNGGEVNMSSSSVSTTFSGHFCTVDSGGVHFG